MVSLVSEVLEKFGDSIPRPPRLKLAKSNTRLLVFFCFYIMFLIIGASIFSAIEAPREIRMINEIRHQKKVFMNNFKINKGKIYK